MLRVQFEGFDVEKTMQKIQKNIEEDLRDNPEKILDSYVGDIIEGNCSKCGKTNLEILTKGQAKCVRCGCVTKLDLSIDYK